MLHELLLKHRNALDCQGELRAQQNVSRSVNLLSGNVTANEKNVTGGVSARVYRNGAYGFASAAEYDDESIGKVVSAARKNAKFLEDRADTGKGPLAPISGGDVAPKKISGDIPQKMLLDFVREVDAYVQKKYTNIVSRNISANCLDMEKLLVTYDGATSHSLVPRSLIGVSMTALDGDGTPVVNAKNTGGYGFFDELFVSTEQLYMNIDEVYEQLMHKREAVFANAGTWRCVFGPDLAGILAHEAVGHTVEGDIVLGGSVAAHRMNKVVGSERVTIVDFANTALGKTCPVPLYVDDEGVIGEDVTLIEKGILRNYMHSRQTALALGMKPCGNARAFAYFDEPLVRMRNTAILPGKDKLADMIASIDDGYYLVKPSNGQADSTGEFMFGISLGYEIKNGKIGRAIKDTTISGVAFEMLKTVDMVSDDMSWTAAGMCGKKQAIPVGMGGAAVRAEINIGGR